MADTPAVAASGARAVAAGGDISGTVITGDVRIEAGSLPARPAGAGLAGRAGPSAGGPRAGTFVGRDLGELRRCSPGRRSWSGRSSRAWAGGGSPSWSGSTPTRYRREYPVACWITADSPAESRTRPVRAGGGAASADRPGGRLGPGRRLGARLVGGPPGLAGGAGQRRGSRRRPGLRRPALLGHLVITTRRDVFWPGLTALSLPVLDEQAALELLRSIAGESPDEVLAEIAAELGHLPLALEQAAAYMRHARCGPARYLRELRADPALAHGRSPQAGTRSGSSPGCGTTTSPRWATTTTSCASWPAWPRRRAPIPVRRRVGRRAGGAGLVQHDHPVGAGRDRDDQHAPAVPVGDPSRARPRRSAPGAGQGDRPLDHDGRVPGRPRHRREQLDGLAGPPAAHRRARLLLPRGSEPAELSLLLTRAGVFLLAQGRHRRAHDLAARALVIAERGHGPDHPAIATFLGNLAAAASDLGRSGRPSPSKNARWPSPKPPTAPTTPTSPPA